MKTNPFYKNNKNRNMDPKEKENINEEELMSEAAQKEAAENEESQTEDVQDEIAATAGMLSDRRAFSQCLRLHHRVRFSPRTVYPAFHGTA